MSFSIRDASNQAHDDAQAPRSERPAGLSEGETALLNGSIRKALGLEPDDVRLGLRLAANRMRRGAANEALRVYVALVLCEPRNVEFQIALANCALRLNEFCLALQAASVVVASEPQNYRGYYLSGRACLALGHAAEAEEDLRQALDLARRAKESAAFAEIGLLLKKMSALGAA